MKACEWCGSWFEPSVSYQIYCSVDCRDDATKEKIVERHKILRRQKRNSKTRLCAGCGKKLSIYNDYTMCDGCYISSKELNKKIREIKGFINEDSD